MEIALIFKCVFFNLQCIFSVFNLSEKRISPIHVKVLCIIKYTQPTTLTKLLRFFRNVLFLQMFNSEYCKCTFFLVQILEGHTNKKHPHSRVYKITEKLNGMIMLLEPSMQLLTIPF